MSVQKLQKLETLFLKLQQNICSYNTVRKYYLCILNQRFLRVFVFLRQKCALFAVFLVIRHDLIFRQALPSFPEHMEPLERIL